MRTKRDFLCGGARIAIALVAALGGIFSSDPAARAAPALSCDSALFGGTVYDAGTQSMFLCNPSGWGGVGGWVASGGVIYPSNSAASVGIGITNPTQALEIADRKAFRLGSTFVSSGGGFAHFGNNAWYDGTTWHIPDSAKRSGLVQIQPDGSIWLYQTQTAGASDWVAGLQVTSSGIRPSSTGIGVGGACSPEGTIAYDAAIHSPVYCNDAGVWARMSGGDPPAGGWCGLSFANDGGYDGMFMNGSPAPGTINCKGMNPQSGCPAGYIHMNFCFESSLYSNCNHFYTCIKQ